MSILNLARIACLLLAGMCATKSLSWELDTSVAYIAALNSIQGTSSTSREVGDFDQYNWALYVQDDVYGFYCTIWVLSFNYPYVNGYAQPPGGTPTSQGSGEDATHAVMHCNFTTMVEREMEGVRPTLRSPTGFCDVLFLLSVYAVDSV